MEQSILYWHFSRFLSRTPHPGGMMLSCGLQWFGSPRPPDVFQLISVRLALRECGGYRHAFHLRHGAIALAA